MVLGEAGNSSTPIAPAAPTDSPRIGASGPFSYTEPIMDLARAIDRCADTRRDLSTMPLPEQALLTDDLDRAMRDLARIRQALIVLRSRSLGL